MTRPEGSESWNADVARVSAELTSRLRSRGIGVSDEDSPDDVMELVEALEAFENAVESQGGDLMVDEPPAAGRAQPDEQRFLLPTRSADETVASYIKRLRAATAALRLTQ